MFFHRHTAINTVYLCKTSRRSMSHQNNVLLANQKEESQEKRERKRPLNPERADKVSIAEFQSFPVSFQSLTTDLEMLMSHLLIADSRSRPVLHFWWMRCKNRHSFGKQKHLFGLTLTLYNHLNKEGRDVLAPILAGSHMCRRQTWWCYADNDF